MLCVYSRDLKLFWVLGLKPQTRHVVTAAILIACTGHWPTHKSARNNHVLACNYAKYLFTHRLSYKPFLIWLLTTPTTPEICSYTTLYFVVNGLFFDINVGSLQGAVGFLITI